MTNPEDKAATTNDLRALWKSGVWLSVAWIELAPANIDIRFALTVLERDRSTDGELANDPRYKEQLGWIPDDWEGRQHARDALEANWRFNLLNDLFSGFFWAIGLRATSIGDDEYVRVPARLFFAKDKTQFPAHVYWDREAVVLGDEAYAEVKVAVVGSTNSPKEIGGTQRSPGRPNTREQIRSKAIELLKLSAFRNLRDRKAQARRLRAELLGPESLNDDARSGYTTDFIKRIIGEVDNRKG